jgi:hypothetical protein
MLSIPFLFLLDLTRSVDKSHRASLATYVKSLKKPSISERNDLEEKRRCLQIRISSYEKQCASLPIFGGDGIDLESYSLRGSELEEQEQEQEQEQVDELQPEAVAIFLPSNVSKKDQMNHDLQEMKISEVKLRIGQINDALQGLRIALGEKSLVYREKVR